jgi:putative iron-dependent peroxidase
VTLQPGILALGTANHCHVELDRRDGVDASVFVRALARLEEPPVALGGANLVVGLRPSLWLGSGARDFDDPVVGPDGFTMPATQHDGWLWVAGPSQDVVFDLTRAFLDQLAEVAVLRRDVTGWVYRRARDLTGFEDGTENPPLAEVPAVVQDLETGSSVVLLQQWRHLADRWSELKDEEQERVMGRTKPDSVELDDLPADSHVARTVVEEDGEEQEVFRRNVAYGSVSDHGTFFVGFSDRQALLHTMLERMAGVGDGVRDALTRFAEPLTGSYYVVPSVEQLSDLR